MAVTRIVNCPECHLICAWCSWYLKNARAIGCGSGSKRKCSWGQQAKGTVCSVCDGSGKVMATITYSRIQA